MGGGPTTWFEAYEACTGSKMVLDSAPVVSRDGLRFVTVGRGAPRETLAKRIQVRSRTRTGEFPTEWDFELPLWARDRAPLDWGPVNPRWLTATSIRFDRVDRRGMQVGTATATLRDHTWQFAVDPP